MHRYNTPNKVVIKSHIGVTMAIMLGSIGVEDGYTIPTRRT